MVQDGEACGRTGKRRRKWFGFTSLPAAPARSRDAAAPRIFSPHFPESTLAPLELNVPHLPAATAVLRRCAARVADLSGQVFSGQRRPQRLLDEVETLLSVALAIAFAHLVGAHNVGWAAFSGYMVMRSQLAESLNRGLLRVIGTACGAGVAWGIATYAGQSPLVAGIALALVGGLTMYASLTRRHSYAWLFTGLTFAMVILDAVDAPLAEVGRFVRTRVLEVGAGTCACIVVSLLSAWTLRPAIHGPQHLRRPRPGGAGPAWHLHAAISALQVACCLGALPLLAQRAGGELASQAAITIMAAMVVPLAALTDGSGSVRRRSFLRLAGCLLGATCGALALVFSAGNVPATLLLMAAGVMLGRHVENSGSGIAYLGTQFALVFLVVFVPDDYRFISSQPGWSRLAGILVGLACLLLVRGASALLARLKDRKARAV